jgi:hypothetical protein
VLACAGDIVTMETVAAAQILRERLPSLKVRVVNVIDLMGLLRLRDHPHGMSQEYFSALSTDTVDVVFAFHGFPGAIHQLVHGRPDADRFRVRGFIEQGTTTHTVRHGGSQSGLAVPLGDRRPQQRHPTAQRHRRPHNLVRAEAARTLRLRRRALRGPSRGTAVDAQPPTTLT